MAVEFPAKIHVELAGQAFEKKLSIKDAQVLRSVVATRANEGLTTPVALNGHFLSAEGVEAAYIWLPVGPGTNFYIQFPGPLDPLDENAGARVDQILNLLQTAPDTVVSFDA